MATARSRCIGLCKPSWRSGWRERGGITDCANFGIELLVAGVSDDVANKANWRTSKALAPHALAVLGKGTPDQLSAKLALKIGAYYQEVARYAEAQRLLSAPWPTRKRCSAPSIPTLFYASTSSLLCLVVGAIWRPHEGLLNALWPSRKRCSVPSILTSPGA